MTNQQIIQALTQRNIARVSAYVEMGMTYADAKARAMSESTAGPAVWAAVDTHFQ